MVHIRLFSPSVKFRIEISTKFVREARSFVGIEMVTTQRLLYVPICDWNDFINWNWVIDLTMSSKFRHQVVQLTLSIGVVFTTIPDTESEGWGKNLSRIRLFQGTILMRLLQLLNSRVWRNNGWWSWLLFKKKNSISR